MPSYRSSIRKAIPPIFTYDEQIRQKYPMVAGADEAGRGPLAGPVVAASVILPPGLVIEGIRDSKTIPDEGERKRLFWKIVGHAVFIGIGIVGADTIDRINILESTKLAMKLAIEDLELKPDMLLIDAVRLPLVPVRQQSIIKGESVSASIAAASIVAKVVRDDIMHDYHERYPLYNFKDHKGYSTKGHMECINKYGPCPIHRKSFRKVIDIPLPFE